MVAARGIEAEHAYWSTLGSYSGDDNDACGQAVSSLLAHGRVREALASVLCPTGRSVPPVTIVTLLDAVPAYLATEAGPSRASDLRFDIENALERLDAYPNVQTTDLARLEWMPLPLLDEHGRGWRALKAHLRSNPEELATSLRLAGFPREDGAADEIGAGLTDEQVRGHARKADRVLGGFGYVPGLAEAEPNTEGELRRWVTAALSAADAVSRRGPAAHSIGEALSQAPAAPGSVWPPDHVARVLEEIWC